MEISLIFCLIVVAVLALCVIGLFYYTSLMQKKYDMLQAGFEDLEALNRRLRAERHDYMNHLQVVLSMIELEEYGNLKGYLEPVYEDIQKTGKALKTANPAVNALLAAKMAEAERKGIDLRLQVKSDLRHITVPDWELCKVLSNIIDNAMTALSEDDRQQRKTITVDLTEDREQYVFEIANNGPAIPPEMQKNIFKYGVTSKKEEGHGVGLAIVNKVIRESGGTISLRSDEEETAFTISLQKERKEDT